MRYFFISYTYTFNRGSAFGFSDIIINVDNDQIFNIIQLKNNIKKENKYESVTIISFQELNKNDFEQMKSDILNS